MEQFVDSLLRVRWVCLAAAVLFLAFPTRQYYWDGVLFALKIESAGSDGIAPLIHPNHLFFSVLGFFAYWPLHAVFHGLRALPLLQCLNSLLSVAIGWLLGTMLEHFGSTRQLAALLTAVFLFGAEWWKFSVDSDAYILTTLLLLTAANALIFPAKRPLLVAGVFHCAAMLMHELGVFFLAAVWISTALRRTTSARSRVLLAARYTVFVGAGTLAAYHGGFLLSDASGRYSFPSWIRSHSSDSAFTATPGYILAGTAKSYVQLLFGGRLKLLVEFFEPWMIVPILVIVFASVALIAVIWKHRLALTDALRHSFSAAALQPAFRIATTWFLAYAVFLLFWLPRNTFYKLLCWPALIVGVACALAGKLDTFGTRRALLLFVTVQVCWNFLFFIYPYSKPASNPLLGFAGAANKKWPDGTTILFRTFNTDDWTIRYFTPQTAWKSIGGSAEDFIHAIETERHNGAVWLDGSAVEFLRKDSSRTAEWLRREESSGTIEPCCGSASSVTFLEVKKR